jgi:excisionase family DNA binding protein
MMTTTDLEAPENDQDRSQMDEEASELLTPQQAAKLLQVPVSFIYERTRLNSIPVKHIGKYVRIPKAELLAWVDAHSQVV